MTDLDTTPAPSNAPDGDAAPGNLAAIDLGSNSFHMIVARVERGQVHVVDRLREPVRLAMGLNRKGRISRKAQERAFDTLRRFGQRVGHLPAENVRAVSTSTLRKARGSKAFVKRAQRLLGHDIEVISGQEEARLIYLGVAHDVQPPRGTRLVIDIGGGSTEIMHGEGLELTRADSLDMGCVSFTQRFFPKGRIRKKALARARTAARLELEPVRGRLANRQWEHALGASGTVRAVARLARTQGYCRTGITADGMRQVLTYLAELENATELPPEAVSPHRAPVLAAGASILGAILEDLDIPRVQVADGALREGALYDLLGRFRQEDVREVTVERMMARHAVDAAQAARIEHTALDLLEQVFADWQIQGGASKAMLTWACRLHEIGMSVAHSGYHRHGAYLIANATMPGFSRGEQEVLATLVLNHRRRVRLRAFEVLPTPRRRRAVRLAILLRLAVRLHRSRSPDPLPPVHLSVEGDELSLELPEGWLDDHPLTRADLDVEAARLAEAGFYLEYA